MPRPAVNQTSQNRPASFFTLPAELRNRIYELTIPTNYTITIQNHFSPSPGDSPQRTTFCLSIDDTRIHAPSLPTLESLSTADPRLTHEAHSFFHANNTFHLLFRPSAHDPLADTDTPFLHACVLLLQRIGPSGRPVLRSLHLQDRRAEDATGTLKYDIAAAAPGLQTRFFAMLADCGNLETLRVDNVLALAPAAMRRRVRHARKDCAAAYEMLSSHFAALPRLRRLTLGYAPAPCDSPPEEWHSESDVLARRRERYGEMMLGLGEVLRERLHGEVEVSVYPDLGYRLEWDGWEEMMRRMAGPAKTGMGAPSSRRRD